MKTSRIALFILAPVLVLLLPLAVYLSDRSINSGTLARNVAIAGVDVAGLSPDEALAVVRAYHNDLYAEPSRFGVNGRTFELNPAEVGMIIDADSALAEAIASSDHGILDGILPWFKSFSSGSDIPVAITVNGQAIDAYLDRWESAAIPVPAFDGGIEVIDGKVHVEYPKSGLLIERETARDIVRATLIGGQQDEVEIPLIDLPAVLSDDDLDAAAAIVEQLIGRRVTLRSSEFDYALTVTSDQIARAVVIDIITVGDPRIDITLDREAVLKILEPRLPDFEQPPVEVQIETSVATSRVTVTPPQNGTRVDVDAFTDALYGAALDGGHGVLPIVADVEPKFTVEQVEGWGPLGLVSSFTTIYAPGHPRVTNIQTMARTIDGSIVWPGETFSINETVGQRTEAKGYVRDGAIINGEVYCCDSPVNVGGGVSQFGTTFFNAVFFGGYEDVEHQPHSIYFSKYPEGREATLGYMHPDVVFRNNTDAPVIIRTAYTSTSITVLFFGNNGGLKVASERSDRRNFTEPRVIYEENPALSPGTEEVVSRGSEGWTVTVTRVITYPDGTVERERFTWRYRGSAKKIQVASCATVSGSARCTTPPSTTTSTTSPTTTVPPTTTTVPEGTTSTTQAPTTTTEPPPEETTTTTTTTEPPPEETTTTTTVAP